MTLEWSEDGGVVSFIPKLPADKKVKVFKCSLVSSEAALQAVISSRFKIIGYEASGFGPVMHDVADSYFNCKIGYGPNEQTLNVFIKDQAPLVFRGGKEIEECHGA